METREKNNTTAGFLFWTPAPVRASPTSSAASGDEAEAEKEDDFHRQMDQNGIIGLTEAVENAGLEETYDDVMFQTEEVRERMEEQSEELLTTVKGYRNITEASESEEEQWERSNYREKKCERTNISKDARTRHGVNQEKIALKQVAGAHAVEPPGISSHDSQISLCPFAISSAPFPHLRHFTAEELAEAPGILSESSLVLDCTESLTGSRSSHVSDLSSKVQRDELSPSCSPVPEPQDTFSDELFVRTKNACRGQASPSPSRMKQDAPKAKHSQTQSLGKVGTESSKSTCQTASPQSHPSSCKARPTTAAVDQSRKQPLTYRTPDFSKVEPRVCLPKNNYKPPKSRFCWRMQSDPPNGADGVKEVVLSSTDGPQTRSDSGPAVSMGLTVCQDEDTLLLQENYNTLLIKHAEAENIIDQLRLEAKVNLHSNPPIPGSSVQSGLTQQGSKVMTLDFPRSQRAEINCSSSLHSNGHGDSPSCPSPPTSTHSRCLDEQMGQNLYKQILMFVLQLQDFENLIQNGKLKALEQLERLTQLEQKLDSLKNRYLSARNEHRHFQQRGGQISQFDPNRELESLLVQYEIRLDELREPLGAVTQDQPTCAVSPSSPPLLSPASVSTSVGELLPQKQLSTKPWLPKDSGAIAQVDVRSTSEECVEEDEGTGDEETLSSFYLNTLKDKHRQAEQDFSMEMDERYQSYKELPKVLSCGQAEQALRNKVQQEVEVKGSGKREVRKSFPQRSDHQDSISKQSRPPSRQVSSHSTSRPAYRPPGSRKLKARMPHSSSLSSLEDGGPSERRKQLKHQSGKVFSQDGIVSPEMDSGFVGSESGRLACATASSPLHQMAPMSVLVHHELHPMMHQTHSVSAPPPPASLSSLRQTSPELSGSDKLRTTQHQDKRRTLECCITQLHVSHTTPCRPESQTTSSVSEEEQSDELCDSSSSVPSYSLSPSPDSSCHHDEPLSNQKANYGVMLQNLQAEVSRLKRRLESSLRKSVRATASDQGNTITPRAGTEDIMSNVSRGRRVRHMAEESTLRPAARNSSASICRHNAQPHIYSGSLSHPARPHISRWTQTSATPPSNCPDTNTTHSRRKLSSKKPHPHDPESLPCTTQPHISRCTQTSAAPHSNYSDTNTAHSRRKLPSKKTRPHAQHSGSSEQVCKAADEPDGKGRAAVCPQCSFHYCGHAERPAGGDKELMLFSCTCHCPLCGCPKTNKNCQPAVRSTPVLLQCVPAYTPPYLFYCGPAGESYPQPLIVSPSSNKGTLLGVRGQTEASSSMSISLDRAIRAARRMKSSSSHMVQYLASGLHYQELLLQPQIY